MLAQLFHAGILKNLSGLVFGKFTDCVPSDPTKPYLTVDQILQEVPAKVKCPVIANFQYGHIAKKLTVPLGLKGRIETTRGRFEVLENAVV